MSVVGSNGFKTLEQEFIKLCFTFRTITTIAILIHAKMELPASKPKTTTTVIVPKDGRERIAANRRFSAKILHATTVSFPFFFCGLLGKPLVVHKM